MFTKKKKEEKPKKGPVKEWLDAIVFAVVAATLIRWVFMEAFTIPTPSMEKSLLVGDFLFVSKISYGPRTPKTPLQIPLTHAKIWGTDIPSYLEWIQLPQYRLPGLGEVERNDVVVFNYPPEFEHPIDLKTHYIKRCIGVPGDILEVKNTQVYINGEPGQNPDEMQFRYYVVTDQTINDRIFENYEIWEYTAINGGYILHTTPAAASELEKLDFVKEVRLAKMPETQVNPRIFPDSRYYAWNSDYYGPIEIPGEGKTIQLDEETLAMYGSTITDYEHHEDVKISEGKLLIDGQEVKEYTFKQNYYFMMGDNRHNSEDSRFWGFVPEDHVVGEAAFIWLSLDANKSLFSKLRWRRFFNIID